MGAWSQSFTCALIDQTSAGGFDDIYRPFNHVPRAFSLFFWVGGRSEGEGALASTGHLIIKHPNINFLHSQFLTKRPRKEVVPEQDPEGVIKNIKGNCWWRAQPESRPSLVRKMDT